MAQWVIVWCETDKSFSLLRDSDVICDVDKLSIDDEVKFFFNKDEWRGIIRMVGVDDDYDDMKKKLKELNALNKKKEHSFHADRPRRCKARFAALSGNNCAQSKCGEGSKPSTKIDKNQIDGAGLKGQLKPLAKLLHDVTDESDGGPNDHEDISPPSSPLSEKDALNRNTNESKRKHDEKDTLFLKRLKNHVSVKDTNVDVNKNVNKNHDYSSKYELDHAYLTWKQSLAGTSSAADGISSVLSTERGSKKGKEEYGKCDGESSIRRRESRNEEEQKKNKEKESVKCDEETSKRQRERESKKEKEQKKNKEKESVKCDEETSKRQRERQSRKEGKHKKIKEDGSNHVRSEGSEDEKTDDGANNTSGHNDSFVGHSNPPHSTPKVPKVSVFGLGCFSDDSDSDNDHRKSKDKKKDSKSVPTPVPTFAGEMFRHSSDDPDVVALKTSEGGKSVYINNKDLKTARSATNAKVFVRSLLQGIFSDEALYKCTVAGAQYRAGGKANMTQKPKLDSSGINIILDIAAARQKNKDWKPSHDRDKLKSALRQKLVDMRPKLKKQFESVNGDADEEN